MMKQKQSLVVILIVLLFGVFGASIASAVVPDAPTIGTAKVSNNVAIVSFTPATTDGANNVTGYTVTSSPGSITGSGTTTPIIVGGLTSGTPYTFTVVANNAVNGAGAASTSSNSVTASMESLATGSSHTLAINSGGTVLAWGSNTNGQLGDGTTNARTTVTTAASVVGITGVVTAVAAGTSHSLAVTSDGTVYAWGLNTYGQLGDNSVIQKATPVAVSFTGLGLTGKIIAVAAGKNHSLALASNGEVWAWGYNFHGELGNTTTTDSKVPVKVSGITNAVFINASFSSDASAAVLADGSVKQWGYVNTGINAYTTTTAPAVVLNLSNVVKVAIGSNHHLALNYDGTIWAWGTNASGQLGKGSTTSSYTPSQLTTTGLSSITSVFTGNGFSAAVKSDGTLWTWGDNTNSQLGYSLSSGSYSVTPQSVVGATQVASAVFNSTDAYAMSTDGLVHKWGSNANNLTERYVTTTTSRLQLNGTVATGANLSVSISASAGKINLCDPKPPAPNTDASITYTISVKNTTNVDASWVTLSNNYGSTTFSSIDAFCLQSGKSCSLGTIAAGQTKTITLITTTSSTGSYSLTSTVQSSSETISTDDFSTKSATVDPNDNCPPTASVTSFTISQGYNVTSTLNYTGTFGTYSATHGVITLIGSATLVNNIYQQSYIFTPDVGYSGDAVITYTVSNKNGSATGTTTITVSFVNHPPVASAASFTTVMGVALNGSLTAVDTDVRNGGADILTYVVLTQPGHGTLTLTNAATGAFTYTPTAGFKGTDSFTFGAKDSNTPAAFSTPATASITILESKAPSTLSLDLSTTSIQLNGSVTASGILSRYCSSGSCNAIDLKSRTVTLTITPPIGNPVTVPLTTSDSDGHYTSTALSNFSQSGMYSIKATFGGDDNALQSTSSMLKSILVGKPAGYAIIIEGMLPTDAEGVKSHTKSARRAWKTLKERNFSDSNIYWFNQGTVKDPANNATLPVNETAPTLAKISALLSGTATYSGGKTLPELMDENPAPIYLIMVDHGSQGKFHLGNEVILPENIDTWLTTLNSKLTTTAAKAEKKIIIIGSCYSGTFINKLSATGRIIITSAGTGEQSYRGGYDGEDNVQSGEYFLDEFFAGLKRFSSIKTAFASASAKTWNYTRKNFSATNSDSAFTAAVQHPLIDDNGDGVGSFLVSDAAGSDGSASSSLYLGVSPGVNSIDDPADLNSVTPTIYRSAGSSDLTTLWASSANNGQVSSAWVELIKPTTSNSATNPDNPTVQQTRTVERSAMTATNNRFEFSDFAFNDPGRYEATYYALDKVTGNISPSKRSVIYVGALNNGTPVAPSLIEPNDSGKVTDPATGNQVAPTPSNILFRWGAGSDNHAISYRLDICTDSALSNCITRDEIAQTFYLLSNSGLSASTTYYWKVSTVDAYGAMSASQKYSFTTNTSNAFPGLFSGYIINAATGIPVSNATLSIDGTPVEGSQAPVNGSFGIPKAANTYTLTAKADGYDPVTITATVVSGLVTTLSIGLPPTAGCGSSNGQSFATIPTANLCQTGVPSDVSGSGPWSWSCLGTGNSTASCSAGITTNTITFVSGGNGTLTGAASQSVSYGGNASAVTAVPNAGYHFVNWTEGSTVIGSTLELSATSLTTAHSYTANFAVDILVNFTSGGNGTISGTTSQVFSSGGTTTSVTAVPAAGYHFVNWTEGLNVVSTSTEFPAANVTTAHSYTANFAINALTVNFASSGNGTLSGISSQPINYGGSATAVTAVPIPGYHFVNWTGTGGLVISAANPLTLTNVTVDQSITANFASDSVTINFISGSNGTLSGTASQTINYGGNAATVTAVPNTGYHFVNWTEGSTVVGTAAALSATYVTNTHSYTANFAVDSIVVNFASGGNGTLTGAVSQSINYGGSATAVTAVPATGYHFVNWTEGTTVVGTLATLPVTNVTAAHTYTANFASDSITVNFASGGNGTLTGNVSQSLSYGGTTSVVTAVPATGYHFVNWTEGTTVVGTAAAFPANYVSTSHNYTANFTSDSITVNFASAGNGTVTGAVSQSINYGGSATVVTAVPATGYHFVNWTDGTTVVGTSATLPVTNVTAAHTYTANFASDSITVNFASGGNGTLTGNASQTINYGSTTSVVTAVPATGFHFVNWTEGTTVVGTAAIFPANYVSTSHNYTANFAANSVNGVCGSSNGGTFQTIPVANLCSDGTSSTVSKVAGTWSWSCSGTDNGTSSSCFAAIDATGPNLKLSTLADGAVTTQTTINISGTVSASSGIKSLSVNGQSVPVTDTSFTVAITLAEGANTITTIATDNMNNTTTDSRSITLDKTAPSLYVAIPSDNSKTAQARATIMGGVSETSNVTITLNNGTPQKAVQTGNIFTSSTFDFAVGVNTITIQVTDLLGNTSSAVRTVTFDNSNPSLAVTSPGQDITITSNSLTISGTVSDTITDAKVAISFNGESYTPTITNGNFSQQLTFPAAGTFPVVITATDDVGHSVSVTRNIIYITAAVSACSQRHWSQPAISSSTMHMAGNLTINGRVSGSCDEVAAFDSSGKLVGVGYVGHAGYYGDMVINGDSSITSLDDEGAITGEKITIRVWDSAAQVEYSAPNVLLITPQQALSAYTKYIGPLSFLDSSFVLANVMVDTGVKIALKTGWNLIGWTTAQGYFDGSTALLKSDLVDGGVMSSMSSKQLSSIFGNMGFAANDAYVVVGPGGAVYAPGSPVNTLKKLLPGKGYWVYANSDKIITVPGSGFTGTEQMALDAGWTQIAYWGADAVDPQAGLNCMAGSFDAVADESGNVYVPGSPVNTLKTMQRNKGYFIHTAAPATLKYTCK